MSNSNQLNSLTNIYDSYFDGLVTGDFEELHWAGKQLSSRTGYLMESAGIDAVMLANTFVQIENPADDIKDQMDFTLCNLIRSYEYSGLSFNSQQVEFVTEFCGFSRGWLRSVVTPTDLVLKHVIGVESRPERRIMRKNGLKAMMALGMIRRLTAPIVRFETRLS